MAVHYKDLGLVNTKVMFQKAVAGGFAVPAYNFNNLEQLQAVILGCVESDSPVILQISKGARSYANQTMLRYMAMGAVEMMKEMGGNIPIVVHLVLRAVWTASWRVQLGDDRRSPAERMSPSPAAS
jgi:fructose-bisphosphate aldolase class II